MDLLEEESKGWEGLGDTEEHAVVRQDVCEGAGRLIMNDEAAPISATTLVTRSNMTPLLQVFVARNPRARLGTFLCHSQSVTGRRGESAGGPPAGPRGPAR